MKKGKCEEWTGVFEQVQEFMERNLEKWNPVNEIRRTYDDFIYNLKKIKELQPELEQDITGEKEDLSGDRDLLMRRLTPVGNILEVYAQDQRIGEKARKLVAEWKKIDSLGPHRILDHSQGVFKLMDKYLSDAGDMDQLTEEASLENAEDGSSETDTGWTGILNDEPAYVSSLFEAESTEDIRRYGLTREMLQELYIAIQQYRSTLKSRDEVIGQLKKLRKKRDGLVRANRKLLKKRLNKLMSVFSGPDPSFWQEYSELAGRNPAG